MAQKKIEKEDKFTEEEFQFLKRTLESKKRACGYVIDHKDDEKIVENAQKSLAMLIEVLGKLELLEEHITLKEEKKEEKE